MTGLATGQLRGSYKQGIWVVAPNELTRGFEYRERGGMWYSEMTGMGECMGSFHGVASEQLCPSTVTFHMFLQFAI